MKQLSFEDKQGFLKALDKRNVSYELMVAAREKRSGVVQELHESGLLTPIYMVEAMRWAARYNAVILAKEVIEINGGKMPTDDYFETPLGIAARNHDSEMIELLLQAGAKVDAQDAKRTSNPEWIAKTQNTHWDAMRVHEQKPERERVLRELTDAEVQTRRLQEVYEAIRIHGSPPKHLVSHVHQTQPGIPEIPTSVVFLSEIDNGRRIEESIRRLDTLLRCKWKT